MTEEELTPYVGQHITLQLDEDQLPEPQRGMEVAGVLSDIVSAPGFPTPRDPDLRIAVLVPKGYELGEPVRQGQVLTVSLPLILGVTGDQG